MGVYPEVSDYLGQGPVELPVQLARKARYHNRTRSYRYLCPNPNALELKALFKFIPARFAKTPQYVDATVADHRL